MKLSRFKLLLIAPSLMLSACGYGLKEVYSGVPYNSSNFFENYYNVWNKSINPYVTGNKITVKKNNIVLDAEKDKVFTSIEDVNFKDLDDRWYYYVYTYDVVTPEDGKLLPYGPSVCLSNYDSSFKYGVVSKMFDGQMFCNGDFANARTQVEPMDRGEGKGFGVLFSKECNDASYFMMNFKCSVVKENDQNLYSGFSDLRLHISFILKNDTGYTYVPVEYEVNDIPTNSGDDHFMPPYNARKKMYTCFGFSLENIDTNRLIGFTLQYEKIADTVSPFYEEETFHAIMLYEVSFPYTTWH